MKIFNLLTSLIISAAAFGGIGASSYRYDTADTNGEPAPLQLTDDSKDSEKDGENCPDCKDDTEKDEKPEYKFAPPENLPKPKHMPKIRR